MEGFEFSLYWEMRCFEVVYRHFSQTMKPFLILFSSVSFQPSKKDQKRYWRRTWYKYVPDDVVVFSENISGTAFMYYRARDWMKEPQMWPDIIGWVVL